MSRNVFWDRHWGHVSQLSAKFSLSLVTVPGVSAVNVPPLWVSCSVCDGVTKLGVAFLSLTGFEYLVALYLNQNLCSTARKT